MHGQGVWLLNKTKEFKFTNEKSNKKTVSETALIINDLILL